MNSDHVVTHFQQQVYRLCSQIPKGKVATYQQLARLLETSARAIGQALKRNPYPPERVPCHRVVCTNGSVGGYFGACGIQQLLVKQKIQRLRDEGVMVDLVTGRIPLDRHRITEECLKVSL